MNPPFDLPDEREQPPPIVTLTTDFGETGAYPGIMKGVVLDRAPHAQLLDLTHTIRPQAVLEGAFVFESAWRYFPAGSIHIVVVDPGVGSTRGRIALGVEGHLFLGPDNGCLSGALPASVRGRRGPGKGYEPRSVSLPPEVVAVSIEHPLVISRTVSATFEGRDVFAPAAGHLARGGLLVDLGRRIDSVLAYPEFHAPARDGVIEGLVLTVDHFGNLITDVYAADLDSSSEVVVAGRSLPIVRTYADASGPCALEGSSGCIEIAVPNGSAASELRLRPGDRVTVARAV